MGIIDTLSAGFSIVNRRPWLILLPILVDFFLWLGPQVTAAPLVERALAQYEQALSGALGQLSAPDAGLPGEAAQQQRAQLQRVAERMQGLNLLGFVAAPFPQVMLSPPERALGSPLPLELVAMPLPSLLVLSSGEAIVPPLPRSQETIGDALALVVLWVVLTPVGFLLAAVYRLALGSTVRGQSFPNRPRAALMGQLWLRLVLLLLLTLAFFLFFFLPALFVASLLSLIHPALTILLVLLASAVPLWLRIYLFFVDGALFVNGEGIFRAMAQSLQIVHHNFWRSLGLIALVYLILIGMPLAFREVMRHPLGMAGAIVGNAYVATGLVAASMIYYRDRWAALQSPRAVPLAQNH